MGGLSALSPLVQSHVDLVRHSRSGAPGGWGSVALLERRGGALSKGQIGGFLVVHVCLKPATTAQVNTHTHTHTVALLGQEWGVRGQGVILGAREGQVHALRLNRERATLPLVTVLHSLKTNP